MMPLGLAGTAAIIAAFAITILRRSSLASRLADRPNERSLHSVVTPRVGGLGLFFAPSNMLWLVLLALVLGMLALAALKKGTPPVPEQAIREAKLTTEALKSDGHA